MYHCPHCKRDDLEADDFYWFQNTRHGRTTTKKSAYCKKCTCVKVSVCYHKRKERKLHPQEQPKPEIKLPPAALHHGPASSGVPIFNPGWTRR